MQSRNSQVTPSIVALVPAHNEEKLIAETIHSLCQQTCPLERVIIISDNSTDGTVAIVRSLMGIYPQLSVMETANNKAKKAGALNQALGHINPRQGDFVLQMDADTILAPDLVEEAMREFTDDPNLGGVCSRCGVKSLPPEATWSQRLVWRVQNLEYGLTDSRRIQKQGHVKVLAGAVTIYRSEVLQRIALLRSGDSSLKVWDERSLVEDYVLTLDVRSLGYQARAGSRMHSWTDVPMTLFGPGGL
jgi:cellulose synthase/poly-beta-1,6-N-acetylglucosamine synthase-like glycosyltransferase